MTRDYSQIQNVLAAVIPQYASNQGVTWARSVMVRNGDELAGGEIRVTPTRVLIHPRLAVNDIVGCCERVLACAQDFDEAQARSRRERYEHGLDHLNEAIRLLGEAEVIHLLDQRPEHQPGPDPDFDRDEMP